MCRLFKWAITFSWTCHYYLYPKGFWNLDLVIDEPTSSLSFFTDFSATTKRKWHQKPHHEQLDAIPVLNSTSKNGKTIQHVAMESRRNQIPAQPTQQWRKNMWKIHLSDLHHCLQSPSRYCNGQMKDKRRRQNVEAYYKRRWVC